MPTQDSADPIMIDTRERHQKILVVGGLGFIGHQVTCNLLDRGYDVHVLDAARRYEKSSETEEAYQNRLRKRNSYVEGATIHIADILETEEVSRIFQTVNPEVVVHLASIPVAGIAILDPIGTASQFVTGTAILLEAARRTQTRRFVYVSSSMVYGDFEVNPVTEDHPTQCRDIYGNMKLASERLAQAYGILYDMDCVTVRPMAVYGPTGHEEFVMTRFVRAALASETLKINGRDTSLDLTFVEDAAEGIALAATHPKAKGEVFNITAGRSRKLFEVTEILSNLIGDVKFEINPRRTHYPIRGGLDITKARTTLGYAPQHDLEQGLKKMVDAYS